jgi:hypothetical protein
MSTTGTGLGIEPTIIGRTGECVEISYHFSMGIGRMRQIATKVTPNAQQPTTDEVVVVTTAKASEVRSQKRLMDSPELEEIRSQDGYMDRTLKSMSAYAGESKRFLLRSELIKAWRAMEAYRTIRRPKLVDAFMAKYEAAEASDFAEQKAALGNAFVRSDYKPADVVRRGFDFWYTIHNVGVLNLDGLPSEIVEQERIKERNARQAAVDEFKSVLRVTLLKYITALFNTVKPQEDGKSRRFYDSSVENVMEFIANYHKQDIADDLPTQAIVASLKQAFNGLTPDMVKESSNLQATLTKKLAEAKAQLGALVEETGRKFR